MGYIILSKFFLSDKSIIFHSVEWKKISCSEYVNPSPHFHIYMERLSSR